MASKSSTLLNAPYDLRICSILSAVDGPIPGTCCSSAELAVFRLIGAAAASSSQARTAEIAQKRNARAKEKLVQEIAQRHSGLIMQQCIFLNQ